MFHKKLDRKIMDLESEITRLKESSHSRDEFKTCSICHCLMHEWDAIKGKSEVKEREVYWGPFGFNLTPEKEEYIYTPYYCGKCAPKEKK